MVAVSPERATTIDPDRKALANEREDGVPNKSSTVHPNAWDRTPHSSAKRASVSTISAASVGSNVASATAICRGRPPSISMIAARSAISSGRVTPGVTPPILLSFVPVFFGQFRQIDLPSDPSPGSHRIKYSIIGSRRSASPSRSSPLAASWRGNGRPQARSRAELYSPSIVIMHGRGWSTAYVSPYHHWDLLAGPKRRSVCRSCDS